MLPYCISIIEDESDKAFMTNLFLQYHRLMYSEIYKIANDEWATEDIIQDILIKLIDKIEKLRSLDRDHLSGYIIAACHNQARNYYRDKSRHTHFPLNEEWDIEDPAQNQDTIEVRLITKAELESMAKLWHLLDDRSRYILEGYYILEQPLKEMAEVLGIRPDSFRMALTRARKKAYKLLRKEIEG